MALPLRTTKDLPRAVFPPGVRPVGRHRWEYHKRQYGPDYDYQSFAPQFRAELVIMLCDLVSRGGNLLLDIGPDADGTIPVVMEERLTQIGSWLKVNGEAIYGTRPFTVAKQWSADEVPKIDYDKEYETAYDIAKLTEKPAPGQAAIDAFEAPPSD